MENSLYEIWVDTIALNKNAVRKHYYSWLEEKTLIAIDALEDIEASDYYDDPDYHEIAREALQKITGNVPVNKNTLLSDLKALREKYAYLETHTCDLTVGPEMIKQIDAIITKLKGGTV